MYAPPTRNDRAYTKLWSSIAYDTNSSLNFKSSYKSFAWVFQTWCPHISIDVDWNGSEFCRAHRFSMTNTNRRKHTLAPNDRDRIWQECGAKYYKQNCVSVRRQWCCSMAPGLHITWPSAPPSRGLCRQSSYARMLVSIRYNFSQCERELICRQSCAGTNLCRITVPE